jgi:N-methylhydantoinase A/oxoprolinase/acetone carboxylase beta subunit
MIVHATGGVCRVAKTKAIDTCDSGPAAGLFGAAFIARMYGMENVVTVDIGGTSTDVGVVTRGEPSYTSERTMAGVPVRERVIETVSIGGGGSSIIRSDAKAGQVKVGPDSAGGMPGPACFALGGTNPAMTDAWVSLGYIDPSFFLGGHRKLDAERGKTTLKRRVADPMHIAVEDAAEQAVKTMSEQCAKLVREFIAARGLMPDDTTMFAFGGAGGLSCAGIAREAGIKRVYFFPFGAQFCAFGSSCTDVVHNYSMAAGIDLTVEFDEAAAERFNRIVTDMMDDAHADMEGEGFEQDKVALQLEAVMVSARSPEPTLIRWSRLFLKSKEDVEDILDLYRARATACEKADVVTVGELRLKASCHLPDPEFRAFDSSGSDPAGAFKVNRAVSWQGQNLQAPVYDQGLLKCGNVVKGLAFVESPHTTILVPPGSRYTVDQFLNGVMEI